VSYRVAVDRMVVTTHRIEVPVDWNEPAGSQITVHAREVVAADLTAEERKAYYDAENQAVDLINGDFYKYAHHVAAAAKGDRAVGGDTSESTA